MSLLGIQCFISLSFLHKGTYLTPHFWPVITGIDIIAVPLYALILREIVKPGSVTLKTAAIVMWMIIDFAIYKHKAVMDDLGQENIGSNNCETEESQLSDLGLRIERLFREDMVFLNPNLKITDVALAVGSNRTYVSAYFNREASTTFYDYINGLRIEYACRLLKKTELSVKIIASKSGYNSPQAFIRVFTKIKGSSPTEYKSFISSC